MHLNEYAFYMNHKQHNEFWRRISETLKLRFKIWELGDISGKDVSEHLNRIDNDIHKVAIEVTGGKYYSPLSLFTSEKDTPKG